MENKTLTHGSLFSGIGGFDLAAEWMGWDNVFQCEIDPFCQKVLKYHFPNTILHNDIKQTDFTIYRGRVDVLTGGFPCQPFSTAGKRKGTADDRHLWPEMLRTIREVQPLYVVGENVRGITNCNGGMVFDQVQIDMENEGFEVLPFLLPACAVNAPHRRDRVWFIAKNTNRTVDGWDETGWNFTKFGNIGTADKIWTTTNPGLFGQEERQKQATGFEQCNKKVIADTDNERFKTRKELQITGDKKQFARTNSEINASYTKGERQQTWKTGTKIIQSQTEKKLYGGNNNEYRERWEKFPTQSPICRGNDGIPHRVDRIKALGNAIVPQVAYEIFKVIDKIENYFR